ncbi:MAG TPA: PIN domain-containing protein [Terriglobia bacterium]|jgi:predicted nucleic acid-binding protein
MGNVLVDAGFLIALLGRRDSNHTWAVIQAKRFPPPWRTCEAVLSEAFHLLGSRGTPAIRALLRREAVLLSFGFAENLDDVLKLMEKYDDVPASLADTCLVRMTEILDSPMILTTDADFHLYRRHGRQAVPCVTPS